MELSSWERPGKRECAFQQFLHTAKPPDFKQTTLPGRLTTLLPPAAVRLALPGLHCLQPAQPCSNPGIKATDYEKQTTTNKKTKQSTVG